MKTKPRGWRYVLGWYCAFQLVALSLLGFALLWQGESPPFQRALLFWFTILTAIVAFKHQALRRWWQAWDEHGRPIDVEVLPPAPIVRASKA